MSESELIDELRKGSIHAFDAIYNKYSKRMYAYCIKFTKSSEDAEEVVQDVFLRLWKIREDIKATDSLSSLLFIISKSYLIKAFHKSINSQIFEDYVNYQDAISSKEKCDSKLCYNDFVAVVKANLLKLPKTQREVIKLSKFEGKSVREISESMSLSEQTVRNQLSLGLKSLRVMLADYVLQTGITFLPYILMTLY